MECPRCGELTGTLTHLDEAFPCGDPGLSCFPLGHWVCASCADESGAQVVLEEEPDEIPNPDDDGEDDDGDEDEDPDDDGDDDLDDEGGEPEEE